MMAYGGETPKRQIAKSNWTEVVSLDTGSMTRKEQKEKTKFKTSSDLVAI